MHKPTIYDIARQCNVSIATVSKVLNGTGRISERTRIRVMRAIEELGYERSAIASALAGKNTYSIGFLLPDVSNPFFAEIVRGAEDEAYRRGYSVLICNTDNDPEREQTYLRTLRQKQMDGLVIATGTASRETLGELDAAGIKVVLLSREIEGAAAGIVTVDNDMGGYLAGRHLAELGHRLIGVAAEPLHVGSSRERLRGFARALAEFGAGHVVAEDQGFGIDAGWQMARKMISEHPITAMFAMNDQLAVGALQACWELGLRVPDDISIVGFDDTILARIVQPPLTTVSQPMQEMGRRTVAMLIDAIESGVRPTKTMFISPTLVVRSSTKPAA